MADPSRPHDSRFVLRWTVGTILGWVAGIAAAVALAQACDAAGAEDLQSAVGIGVGAGVGAVQGRVLSARLGGAGRWARATFLGMAAPFVAGDLLTLAAGVPAALPLSAVLGALLAGWLQQRLLRAHAPAARWWLAASVAGWLVALASVLVSGLLYRVVPPGWTGFAIVVSIWVAGGVGCAVVTGAALRRILGPDAAPAAP